MDRVRYFIRLVYEAYKELYGTDAQRLRSFEFLQIQIAKEAKALAEGLEDLKEPLERYLRELKNLIRED
ncbi:MAG: hypothetical protein DRI26_00140 [Chloroflexi bacterium]|nr:MAG: hypothetical protein DRI26_00140 [Chloroflexota bacterium]